MVTTSSTGNALNNSTIANNGNMLLYSNHNNNNIAAPATLNAGDGISGGVALSSCNTSTTLEQYRLHLYNYALNMERLRGPPYTAAAAMAAAAAYASTSSVTTSAINGVTVHGSSYAATSSGHMSEPAPGPSNYLCTTPAGNLIAATGHMARTSTVLTQGPSGNRLALASMSLFPQRIFQPEEPKPQHSYIGLIAMAILSSAETKLVLSDIYQYILDNYPYFRTRGPGWRNSIRHNLSLNDCFIKSGRSANGKGHYWAIHPANMEDFRKGDFRRRKAQRKVRKHMGLSVDDNGTDSPSPPPAMDLTSPSPPLFQHITPLASAAQHLAAAQSFGWRFTHQHRQTTQAGTNSSYMGQIFTYRPQHYAAAAAAAAAAALCHSGNQHQNHQQSLINVTTHHQAPQMPNSPQQQSASLLTPPNNPAASTENSNSVINEINSQKRKRQFDVASLLAPDHFSKREQQNFSERTSDEITTSMTCNEDLLQEPENSNPNDSLDLEDIDVVDASEDEEDLEADYEDDEDERDSQSLSGSNENEEVDYLRSYNNEHLIHNKINITEEDESIIKNQHFEPPDEDKYEHLKTTRSNKKPANSPERISQQENNHFKTNNKTVPNHNQNHSQHQPLSINNDAQHLFGRYYGTYMAAAAAARINSSISKNSD